MSAPNFSRLEQSAYEVIAILQGIPEFAETKIAIIGGLALWKYMQDVDYIITASGAPSSVKKKLLGLPNTPFVDHAGIFSHKRSDGTLVQIDMTPEWQSPYVPEAATLVSAVKPDALPYISAIDLIVFKINSAGLRATVGKQVRDAVDAATLLEQEAGDGALTITSAQRTAVEGGLSDVVKLTGRPETWWKSKLGL